MSRRRCRIEDRGSISTHEVAVSGALRYQAQGDIRGLHPANRPERGELHGCESPVDGIVSHVEPPVVKAGQNALPSRSIRVARFLWVPRSDFEVPLSLTTGLNRWIDSNAEGGASRYPTLTIDV